MRGRGVRLVEQDVRRAHVVKARREDVVAVPEFTVNDVAARWSALGAQLVVTTDGADRATAYRRTGDPVRRPGRRVMVVDAIGAGDASTSARPAERATSEEAEERRRREREAEQEARRRAAAHNLELGAAVAKGFARVKLDERIVKLLATLNLGGELDRLAMRGARCGFPGWVEETQTRGGEAKTVCIERRADAGAKGRGVPVRRQGGQELAAGCWRWWRWPATRTRAPSPVERRPGARSPTVTTASAATGRRSARTSSTCSITRIS